jgi:hypothetical protein
MKTKVFFIVILIFWAAPCFGQDMLWSKTYGSNFSETGWCVKQTTDGGYIVAGEEWSGGVDVADAFLIKTDSLGDTLWVRAYRIRVTGMLE